MLLIACTLTYPNKTQMLKQALFTIVMTTSILSSTIAQEQSPKELTPVTSAKQYVEYLKTIEEVPDYQAPETVIIIFGRSGMERLLAKHDTQNSKLMRQLHVIDDGKLGVVGDFGIGAPAMVHRVEELIALGVKRFILVGLAGSLTNDLSIGDYALCTQALSEDGVGHLYMPPGEKFSSATPALREAWSRFIGKHHPSHPKFHSVSSWSFPVIFRESQEDIERVTNLGCSTVEMEVGALYAIAREKDVEALALFLISDSLAEGKWHPQLKDKHTKENLTRLTELAMEFVRKESKV